LKSTTIKSVENMLKSYGLESRYLINPHYMLSMEELADEIEASDAAPKPVIDSLPGSVPGENPIPDPNDTSLTSPEAEDAELEGEQNGAVFNDSPAAAPTVMDVIGTYNNVYVGYMSRLLKSANQYILREPKFNTKTNVYYDSFVEPGLKYLALVFKDTEALKTIQDLHLLLCDKGTMAEVAGEKDAPFIFEGLQVLFYELLLIGLSKIPQAIVDGTKTGIEDFEIGSKLLTVAKNILQYKSFLGHQIRFEKPIVSEITKKNPELVGTVYETSKVFTYKGDSDTMFSGESINNLLAIKNNNALVEFTMIIKGLSIAAGLAYGFDLFSKCRDVAKDIKELIDSTEEGAKELCGTLKSKYNVNIDNALSMKFKEITNVEKTATPENPLEAQPEPTPNLDDSGKIGETDEEVNVDTNEEVADDPYDI